MLTTHISAVHDNAVLTGLIQCSMLDNDDKSFVLLNDISYNKIRKR